MSGMVVRELFAKLGLDTDLSSFKRGDAAMKGAEKAAFSLGDAFKYIGAAAVGAFALSTVKAASDVDENLNVIRASFSASADSVVDWAATAGKAMGRSQYAMRDMAASLGAILKPTLQNDEAAAKFSTTLAGLAVDLSSFFNTSEGDALTALRSGLLGESEPLRKFGVTLNDVRLKEEARTLGLLKGKGPMSAAVKAQAAYSLIMKDTASAQGDAARTGGGYANLMRKLEGAFLDVKVAIGGMLLGPAAGFVSWMASAATSMAELITQTNILPAVLIAAGAALIPFVGAWVVANAPLLLAAAAMAAIVLVIEDIYTAMTGGKSVIDDWFASIYGKEHWAEIKKTWQEEFESLMDTAFSFAAKIKAVMSGVWAAITGDKEGAGKALVDGLGLKDSKLGQQLTASGAGKPSAGLAPKDSAMGGLSRFLGLDTTALGQQLSGAGGSVAGGNTSTSTSMQTISAPTTVIINGARDVAETDRRVRKALDDRNRELQRSASGVE